MKKFQIKVNGTLYIIEAEELREGAEPVPVAAVPVQADREEAKPVPEAPAAPVPSAKAAAGGQTISAPMPGTINAIQVTLGQTVKEGDVLFVLEAMKMENEIAAPCAGTVANVYVNKGDTVSAGAPVVQIC